jgi:hypothetical protein
MCIIVFLALALQVFCFLQVYNTLGHSDLFNLKNKHYLSCFLNQDQHDQWRCLGFGTNGYLSSQTKAKQLMETTAPDYLSLQHEQLRLENSKFREWKVLVPYNNS